MFRGVSCPIVKSVTAHVRADDVASSIVCPLANLNIVRLRKRRWIPLTPSKLFVVPKRPEQDPTEYKELKTLYMHYRTKLRSVTHFFRNERLAKLAALTDQSHIDQERQHISWCAKENDKFNEISAGFRATREKSEQTKKEEKLLRTLSELEDKERQAQQRALDEILKLKEQSAHFINPDNIESAINSALNQRLMFNFAIDLEGNRYVEQLDGSTKVLPSSGDEHLKN